MMLDAPFKLLQSNLDIAALKEAVINITEKEWNNNQFRQDRFEVAKNVETILFKMNGADLPSGDNPYFTDIWEDSWSKWKHLVDPVIKQATIGYDGIDNALVNKCLIPRLRPGMNIPEHIDLARSFDFSHRIHVPLFTNPDVVFMVDGVRCVMEEGNAYELNNKTFHSVVNNGDKDRVHLLFDIFIPNTKI